MNKKAQGKISTIKEMDKIFGIDLLKKATEDISFDYGQYLRMN